VGASMLTGGTETMLEKRLAENRFLTSTVPELFRETCRDRPEKTAIVFEGREISYAELQSNADRCSQALLNLGVRAGDHIATIPTPSPEFASLYFGTLQVGAVVNPLNLLWGSIEYEGILRRNDPKIIITVDDHAGRDYIQLLRDTLPDLKSAGEGVSSSTVPTLTHLVSVSRGGNKHRDFIDFQDFLAAGEAVDTGAIERREGAAKCTDLHSIMQTSGSTGLSKSVLLDHRSTLATAHFSAKSVTFAENDRYINLGPFYHNTGIVALNLAIALAGATLYLIERFDPKQAVELVDRERITTTFGFDAHFQAMKRVLDTGRHTFTVNKALCAVQPQTYEMIRNEMCRDPQAKIVQIYAQTENGPGVSGGEPDCPVYDIMKHTNGRPMPGVELVVKDITTGEKLPSNEAGEICYRSPYLFKGYYKQEEETQKSFDEEGYFHSGDYGTFDNGYVRFLGRLGDIVKSGGENVSTAYVSSLLMKLFREDFEDVQTIGIPDPYWGAKIVSWVRMKPGRATMTLEQLKEQCRGKMAQYEIPKALLPWEGPWPMTPIGKLDRAALENETRKRLSSE
jgi:fatty-acyl-CoA synthase